MKALEWLKGTFLYQRIKSSPKLYGFQEGLSLEQMEAVLLKELCLKAVHQLVDEGFVSQQDSDLHLTST
eukprot:Awhi_evm1s10162